MSSRKTKRLQTEGTAGRLPSAADAAVPLGDERSQRSAESPVPQSTNWLLSLPAVGLIVAPICLAFWFVFTYGVNIAWEDQFFSLTSLFEKWYSGSLSLADFWAQHNEHRHFLPRLVMFALGLADRWNTKGEMWLSQALLAANLSILLAAIFRSTNSCWRYWLAAPLAWLVFSLRQHQNMLCGFQLSFVMAATAAVATFFVLATLGNSHRHWLKLAAAALMATLGTVSSGHGLLLWIAGLVPLALLPTPRRKKLVFAAVWTAIGAVEGMFYLLVDYHKTVHPVAEIQQRTIANCTEYFGTVVGAALFPIPTLAKWGGVLLLLIAIITVVLLVRRRSLSENVFWLGLTAFGLLTQAQVAWGRTPFGNDQALSSRYATFSLFVVVGLYGALSSLVARRAGWLALAAWIGLLALIVPGIGLSCWEGGLAGSELKQRMDYHAFVFLTADTQPDGALRFAPWEKTAEIRHNLAVLKEHRLNLFASPENAARWAVPTTLPTLADPPILDTRLSFIAYDKDHVALVLAGYALAAGRKDLAGGVVAEVDGTPYRTYYGLPIDNVPELQQRADLRECGFRREFSSQQLPAGMHSVVVRVLNQEGTGWFASGPPQAVRIPDWPK